MFYPGNARNLAEEVDACSRRGGARAAHRFSKAIVVPCGYIYSGGVAASAYDAVRPGRGIVRRVVLLARCTACRCEASHRERRGVRHAAREVRSTATRSPR